MTEDATGKRLQAAHAIRKFPALFAAVAENRLHLSAVCLLSPWLTKENWAELLAAAEHQTSERIRELLAERFPRPDAPTLVMAIGPSRSDTQHAPEHVHVTCTGHPEAATATPAPAAPRGRVTPLAPQRFKLEFTVGQEARDLLAEAQALLGHAVPNGDVGEVFLRAMREYVKSLKKRRCGAGAKPRAGAKSASARHVPAHIRKQVWERDGSQCTFVSNDGHRCGSRKRLEFDHVTPVAKGGASTAANLRLRCRAHNQHAADQVFGRGFMDRKRTKSRVITKPARTPESPSHRPAPVATEAQRAAAFEAVHWLRQRGTGAGAASGATP